MSRRLAVVRRPAVAGGERVDLPEELTCVPS